MDFALKQAKERTKIKKPEIKIVDVFMSILIIQLIFSFCSNFLQGESLASIVISILISALVPISFTIILVKIATRISIKSYMDTKVHVNELIQSVKGLKRPFNLILLSCLAVMILVLEDTGVAFIEAVRLAILIVYYDFVAETIKRNI